ncbi:MAG: hypothetical protein GX333_04585 [Syntrophomonadaceae bacterium]|nr:hypothetical protein [Syntrophomonadaceae bacterium]
MVKKYLSSLLIVSLLFVVGCDNSLTNSISDKFEKKPLELIKVEITFTDDEALIGYVTALGIEQEKGRVYIGGSSLNYLYDKNGNIIGAYNYQRVLYMKIINEEE